VGIKIEDLSPAVDKTQRTVWGHWPIVLSLQVAVMTAVPLVGLLSPNRDALQDATMRRSAAALVPIAVLIGLSVLVATYLPQSPAKPWVKHAAMWASFVAVAFVAFSGAHVL
jgi:hypothetical protein